MVDMLIPHEGLPLPRHGLGALNDGSRRAAPAIEWPRSPARPALAVGSALDRVRRAPTILAAMLLAPEVVLATRSAIRDGIAPAHVLESLVEAIHDERDTVTAVAAIHALGQVPGGGAAAEISRLIAHAVRGFDAHAIWSMAERTISTDLIGPLVGAVARGGLAGMHAQRVLARWSQADGDALLTCLEADLHDSGVVTSRRYLVETIGLVTGHRARRSLERIGGDAGEHETVRAEAILAFAGRPQERLPASIGRLAVLDDRIGEAVRTVRAQRLLTWRGPRSRHQRSSGIKVAQIHLAAVLDPDASRAGMGDSGGVATLLPRLGAALAEQQRVHEVLTIGRAAAHGPSPRTPVSPATRGHRFDSVPLEEGEGAAFAGQWPALVAAERGSRAALLASGVPDVIHLRMADPGSLAAANVARQLGIPTVFTLAPDPHGPIAAAERRGTLDRRSFAEADARAALWFRATIVGQLARDAREIVLFPRPELRRQLRDLTGIDIKAGPPHHTVVAEGADTQQADDAAAMITTDHSAPVIRDLKVAIERLPAERRGLPIVVSIGRMHAAKGMSRVVEAFALDQALGPSANLVIVGGDLKDPSAAEAAELSRIRMLFDRYPGLEQRVILLGHRPHAETSLVLAVARRGWRDVVGPSGAYVCGSPKEEFGLAIVEAMAAGLPVVAPATGGPATYVEDGVTGALVDTSDAAAIAAGIRDVLALAQDPDTAARTRAVIDDRFTLQRMARTLSAVYRIAAGARTLALPVDRGLAA